MSSAQSLPRTYNQSHLQRTCTPGKRRISIYVSWSYPAEAGRDVTVMDNRFSTMTEVRRAAWPNWESAPFGDPLQFQQGIAGSLELFFRGWLPFQDLIREVTGHAVPVFQRIDQAGFTLPLDERVLGDTDTLLLFGLDHMATQQYPTPAEIEAVKQFLRREGACLILGPHHHVGATDDLEQRAMEYGHHGDPLVPRQQRFAGYLRYRAPRRGRERGYPRLPRWGEAVQFPHASAALRRDERGSRSRAGPRTPAHRPHAAAPLHGGGKRGIQYVSVESAER